MIKMTCYQRKGLPTAIVDLVTLRVIITIMLKGSVDNNV